MLSTFRLHHRHRAAAIMRDSNEVQSISQNREQTSLRLDVLALPGWECYTRHISQKNMKSCAGLVRFDPVVKCCRDTCFADRTVWWFEIFCRPLLFVALKLNLSLCVSTSFTAARSTACL